jgi:hypothetical protein
VIAHWPAEINGVAKERSVGGKIALSREANHLYPIKPHERRWIYAGVTSDNRQTLMGLFWPNLVAFFFDKEGVLLGVEERPLQIAGQNDQHIEHELIAWQEDLGFQPTTILVHKFFVLNEAVTPRENAWHRDGIGIVDFPAFYHDVLAHSEKYTEDEIAHVRIEQPRWDRDGDFVLWWGNDYWFDGTGECVAS